MSTNASSSTSTMSSLLTQEHIEQYKKLGYCVVENVISEDELAVCRDALHRFVLDRHSVDYNKLDADSHSKLPVRPLDIYYSPVRSVCMCVLGSESRFLFELLSVMFPSMQWKLNVLLNERVLAVVSDLWSQTFAVQASGFEHQFGEFDAKQAFAYLDRAAFRCGFCLF